MLNNLEEYIDSLLYEAEYGRYQGDFDFFLNLIKRGSVLDLACGTGRLTIPLAQKGLKVVGLDASDPMLNLARRKAKDLSIQWIQGDMRDFHLNKTFDLIIMAGNAFQALVSEEDQKRALECIRKHLKPSGLFAFNTRNPQTSDFKTTPEFEFWHSFQDSQGETVEVYGKQEADSSRQIVTYVTKRVWKDRETNTSLQLLFTSYQQLTRLLDQTGFEVCEVFGSDQKGPFRQNSPSLLPVCRVKLSNPMNSEKGPAMSETNVDVVEAYYKAMNNKDRAGMAQYVHPDVQFLGPLAELTGRDIVLEAVERLFPLFKNIVVRAKLGSDTQVMFAYDLNCVDPIGTLRVAALMTLEEALITRIELFFDARPFFEKK